MQKASRRMQHKQHKASLKRYMIGPNRSLPPPSLHSPDPALSCLVNESPRAGQVDR